MIRLGINQAEIFKADKVKYIWKNLDENQRRTKEENYKGIYLQQLAKNTAIRQILVDCCHVLQRTGAILDFSDLGATVQESILQDARRLGASDELQTARALLALEFLIDYEPKN